MEKPAKVIPKEESRQLVQHYLHDRKPAPSLKDVRRQLGWGLMEVSHKGALR